MSPIITAFARSPDRGRGLARDMPVRWALEEVGQPYGVHLISFAELKEPAHRALHPFGQIPTYEEGDLALFESGAIVLHIAQQHMGLLPTDANARARAIAWMFAALSTIEPVILELQVAVLLERKESWHEARLPRIQNRIRDRLRPLSDRLGDADWLDGAFSAGDLMMIGVLRRLGASGLLREFPKLAAYVARGEARPAFQRAFAAQLTVFNAASGGA
ncbi:MAG TPA: glutathione S-transferase family protein [Rhizomicrobium sp.]|nr:glutathione S-transferase family protein [Rhizomicrobium sp.]